MLTNSVILMMHHIAMTLLVHDHWLLSDNLKRIKTELRTQNLNIHLFDINYKYIIPLHKKNNMY